MTETFFSHNVSNLQYLEDTTVLPAAPLTNVENLTEDQAQVDFDSDDDCEIIGYEEMVVDGCVKTVQKKARVPINHAFYVDVFYGTAALNSPDASVGTPTQVRSN